MDNVISLDSTGLRTKCQSQTIQVLRTCLNVLDTGTPAASMGKHKIGGIGDDTDNRITGIIADGGIRMGCEAENRGACCRLCR
jgi:thymidine phosphorylase